MCRRACAFVLTAAALAPLGAGCGKESDICEVKGVLTYKGKPMPQVYLRFEPDDLTTKSTSMAVTEADGRFEMMIGSTRGVYRGKVKVFCDDPLAAMGTTSPVPKDIEKEFRALCAKYGTGKSTYTLTIEKSNPNLQLALD